MECTLVLFLYTATIKVQSISQRIQFSIREQITVEDNQVVIDHVVTDSQFADIFTKSLEYTRFITLRNAIRVCKLDH